MNIRENVNAILHYENYDKMPVVAFGYWFETVDQWARQGHITQEEAESYKIYYDNSDGDNKIMKRLGFDFNWNSVLGSHSSLFPFFEKKLIRTEPDGARIVMDGRGLIVREKDGTDSIPSEIGTCLTDRAAYEELYLPKLHVTKDRVNMQGVNDYINIKNRELPVGLHAGSLIGAIRDLLGVEHLSYLYADDEELYAEICQRYGDICYDNVKTILETGAKFDYIHFWEDICYKNGPLVSPNVFKQYVAPNYKRISDLGKQYGIDIVSVDCDGLIDSLISIWLENGVNTMFPIEVGTWDASIAPWREKYGKQIRGVGGMNKNVFSRDKKAVEDEVERLKRLIDLGGFIPCPDHRIAPDAKFELVQYYCSLMQKN